MRGKVQIYMREVFYHQSSKLSVPIFLTSFRFLKVVRKSYLQQTIQQSCMRASFPRNGPLEEPPLLPPSWLCLPPPPASENRPGTLGKIAFSVHCCCSSLLILIRRRSLSQSEQVLFAFVRHLAESGGRGRVEAGKEAVATSEEKDSLRSPTSLAAFGRRRHYLLESSLDCSDNVL